ncbi:65-kDa microtubule-associated protein 6-like [Sesamum indicum]|uniref:65-kDa microtubule-associated protein 6-like n=1 Tax=Sesamum indicum TaxID=4182 RepID=A0A8M8USZ0_SESIN|nr:65-kDa microtubule-associated protein 6-like [Sesamum indicum]
MNKEDEDSGIHVAGVFLGFPENVPAPLPLEPLGKMKKMALSLYPQSEILQKVLDYVNEVHTLTSVLSLDFGKTVSDVHPSLHGSCMELVTNISNSILEGLDQAILGLKTERKFRLQKLKDVAGSLSRKDIIDKIDRWLSACDEEKWLEDYNQDDNRYSAGRGAHINLKRAERARIMVNKIPVMVDNLISKTLAWEDEKQKLFLGARLISILEDYKHARQHKEEEKKRARADTRSKGCDWKSTYLREMACRITPNAIEDDLKFSTQELFLIDAPAYDEHYEQMD